MITVENPAGTISSLVSPFIIGLVLDQLLFFYISARTTGREPRTWARIAAGFRWMPASLGLVAGLWLTLDGMVLTGAAARWLPSAPRVLGILVLTLFTTRVLGRLVRILTQREDVPVPSSSILVNLVRGSAVVIGLFAILATLGISVAPLVTALGVGGLAVGLALQPTLENLFSGVQIIASRNIEPGDFIRLPTGEEGTVVDIDWRHTTMLRPSNDLVFVPNSVLSRSTVTNYSRPEAEHVLTVPVAFSVHLDLDTIERMLLEVAHETLLSADGAVADSEPGVRLAEYSPPAAMFNVTIRCTAYTERIGVRHEFLRRLASRCADESLETPSVPFALPRT
jgi:small-conductance mechanosensitive channel